MCLLGAVDLDQTAPETVSSLRDALARWERLRVLLGDWHRDIRSGLRGRSTARKVARTYRQGPSGRGRNVKLLAGDQYLGR